MKLLQQRKIRTMEMEFGNHLMNERAMLGYNEMTSEKNVNEANPIHFIPSISPCIPYNFQQTTNWKSDDRLGSVLMSS